MTKLGGRMRWERKGGSWSCHGSPKTRQEAVFLISSLSPVSRCISSGNFLISSLPLVSCCTSSGNFLHLLLNTSLFNSILYSCNIYWSARASEERIDYILRFLPSSSSISFESNETWFSLRLSHSERVHLYLSLSLSERVQGSFPYLHLNRCPSSPSSGWWFQGLTHTWTKKWRKG